jgi:hypothetical protein
VLLDQMGALGDVIVITAKRAVAKWARTVAHVATPLGTRLELTPVVLYVSPEMSERLLSEAHPELAVIAVWAIVGRHGPAAQRVVKRALEVTRTLPAQLRQVQRGCDLDVAERADDRVAEGDESVLGQDPDVGHRVEAQGGDASRR